uniref:Uncharacterized protein n=1 Tax=Arion vulgaris TaxID=1028688 RepID=A0A0B6YUC6_9EUPU
MFRNTTVLIQLSYFLLQLTYTSCTTEVISTLNAANINTIIPICRYQLFTNNRWQRDISNENT